MTHVQTKEDLMKWLDQMVPKDLAFLNQSGAAYLPEIRELEAILRPLWAILPAYFSGAALSSDEQFYIEELKPLLTLRRKQA